MVAAVSESGARPDRAGERAGSGWQDGARVLGRRPQL